MACLPNGSGGDLSDGAEYLAPVAGATGPLASESEEPLRADRAAAPLETMRAIGLSLALDRLSEAPLHEQLTDQLRGAIEGGRLAHGARLPSTRLVAQHLAVSRNVVAEAYSKLERAGLLVPRRGAGTFVNSSGDTVRGRPQASTTVRWLRGDVPRAPMLAVGRIDLRLRGGSLAPLPDVAWRRAWRMASSVLPAGYSDAGGDPALREAIAGYVTRTRGVACAAADIVVTSGASDALALLMRTVWSPGEAVAVEEPGYPSVVSIASGLGAPIVRLPVDAAGADVSVLTRSSRDVLAVHLTPSHQFPLGIELTGERRRALLAWARSAGGLVVENDYDAEFRFGDDALPPLAASDELGCVVLVGTFSRLLAPALRVGYLVATAPLAARISELKRELDDYASLPAQHAVAHLIRSGELERHLRRVRAMATYKRTRIAAGLDGIAGVRLSGLDGGLHALVELDDAARLVEPLARRGVLVDDLSSFYSGPATREALLIDYGAPTVAQLDAGLEVVREVLSHR